MAESSVDEALKEDPGLETLNAHAERLGAPYLVKVIEAAYENRNEPNSRKWIECAAAAARKLSGITLSAREILPLCDLAGEEPVVARALQEMTIPDSAHLFIDMVCLCDYGDCRLDTFMKYHSTKGWTEYINLVQLHHHWDNTVWALDETQEPLESEYNLWEETWDNFDPSLSQTLLEQFGPINLCEEDMLDTFTLLHKYNHPGLEGFLVYLLRSGGEGYVPWMVKELGVNPDKVIAVLEREVDILKRLRPGPGERKSIWKHLSE